MEKNKSELPYHRRPEVIKRMKEYAKNHKEYYTKKQKEYYQKSKDERQKKSKKYYQDKKEIISKQQKEYREKNKKKIKDYFEKNKEILAKKHKEYEKRNRAIIAKRHKEYGKSENGKLVAKKAILKRKERKNNIIHIFTIDEWKDKVGRQNGICPYCLKYVGNEKLTLDHIYPISKADKDFKETGIKRIYKIDDIMPCCGGCNSSKRDKIIDELSSKQEKEC